MKKWTAFGGVFGTLIGVWWLVHFYKLVNPDVFPSPEGVAQGFWQEISSGRLLTDLVASLFRVAAGFGLALLLGIPAGLWLGKSIMARDTLLPFLNFLRNLSPLAWIPFAVLWFGIGDAPAIFLIFLATFFPLLLASTASVASVPRVFLRVAHDSEFSSTEILFKVVLPSILPQLLTSIRMTAGIAWIVVVPAEMLAGRDGLGFAVMDARNGLRTDLLVVAMIVIGLIGIALDLLFVRLQKIPFVRWGYEQ